MDGKEKALEKSFSVNANLKLIEMCIQSNIPPIQLQSAENYFYYYHQ